MSHRFFIKGWCIFPSGRVKRIARKKDRVSSVARDRFEKGDVAWCSRIRRQRLHQSFEKIIG